MENIKQIEKIKKLSIKSIVSDDFLMSKLVFKGGNAIDLIYKISERASFDLDFSMEKEFSFKEIPQIEKRVKDALQKTFEEESFFVFDINFIEKPKKISKKNKDFWGGYQIDFKIIECNKYVELKNDINQLRRNAFVTGLKNHRKFKIDISKFEFCNNKVKKDFEGYAIYVYTLEMLILEKIRAICQQHSDYIKILNTNTASGRARDFFDIYILIEKCFINIETKENIETLKTLFEIKKVPLNLLNKIEEQREFHRQDFSSLQDTIKTNVILESFDFYFDYVVSKAKKLSKAFRIE